MAGGSIAVACSRRQLQSEYKFATHRVNEAAGKLQAEGLIHYSRGHISVLDRPRLERRVCECYAVVKKEYDRLLPYEHATI